MGLFYRIKALRPEQMRHNRTLLSEKEEFMRVLIICAAFCAAALGSPQESGLTPSDRDAIEKAVLEANAQMTHAAEDRDINRLFSFMLPNERGSIIQSGRPFPTPQQGPATANR